MRKKYHKCASCGSDNVFNISARKNVVCVYCRDCKTIGDDISAETGQKIIPTKMEAETAFRQRLRRKKKALQATVDDHLDDNLQLSIFKNDEDPDP